MVYTLECITCINAGIQRVYWGESSWSPYQRGQEHQQDINSGLMSNPLVVHFWEEHVGEQQEILMRVVSKHMTALAW